MTLHFAYVEGRVECIGVDIRSFRWAGETYGPRKLRGTEPQAVTTSDLRSLRLAEIIDEQRAQLKATLFADTGDREWDETPWASGQMEQWEPKKVGRPPVYGPDHFVEVARVYREAYARNRTPTRAVATHFQTTEAAAAKWVARCRELGLLPPTTQGKAKVGKLKPAAKSVASKPHGKRRG